MSEHTLAILVKALGTGEASKKLKGIDAVVAGIGQTAHKGIGTAVSNLTTLGMVAAGVAAGGLVAAVKAAGDFEAQLRTINTVAQASPKELLAIGDGMRQLARDTGTDLSDLTQGYYDLVSAGVKTADAQNVLTAANTLAIGGLATTAQTVDLLTTAINAYGGDAKQAGAYADDFAKAIELGKVTAADIAASFADVGALAAQNGISVREVAESYAFLTAQGVPAAETTTQMGRAILELIQPSAAVASLQDKLGKNYAALANKKGLVPALQELRTDADKAKIPLVDLFGRVEGFKFLLETTGPNFAKFSEVTTQFGDDAGTAARQMGERQQGLNYELRRLKALAIDAAITIGNKLLPKITPLAERAVKFLDTHQGDISAFGDKIAGAFDKALQFAEKIPWGAIGSGLQTAASWAGQLMDVFLKLPADTQGLIFALVGLNKLTGGAVGSIVGQLGAGLIKGVLGMTAGVVNINAGTVTGAGAAGAAGAAKGGSSLLGALGVAAIIDVVAAEVVGPVVRDWAIKNGLAGSGDTAGKTDSQLARERADAAMKEQTSLLDVIGRNTSDVSHETRDTRAAVNAAKDAIVRQKLSVAVSMSNKVYLSAREVVSTTTQTKILAGGIQQI